MLNLHAYDFILTPYSYHDSFLKHKSPLLEDSFLLLTKEQLVNEIINRATLTGRSAFVSSQGSGVISKLTEDQKIQRLRDNVDGKYADKLGWGFNPKTEEDLYKHFQKNYLVTPAEIKGIVNGV